MICTVQIEIKGVQKVKDAISLDETHSQLKIMSRSNQVCIRTRGRKNTPIQTEFKSDSLNLHMNSGSAGIKAVFPLKLFFSRIQKLLRLYRVSGKIEMLSSRYPFRCLISVCRLAWRPGSFSPGPTRRTSTTFRAQS